MIKAEELRIGNYIYGVSDRVETIKELLTPYAETAFRGGLLHYSKYEDLQPIPLSEEWLVTFWFEFDTVTWRKGRVMLSQGKSGKWAVWYGTLTHGRIDECDIEFVHSLQNLIFILTQKELTC